MFEPNKFPNEEVYRVDPVTKNFIEIIKINYEPFYYASIKKDGYSCIFKDGEMLMSSLKSYPNKQINEKFQVLKNYSKETGKIICGEIYAHGYTCDEIGSFCRTEDFEDKKQIKKYGYIRQLPENLMFHIYDVADSEYEFEYRIEQYNLIQKLFPHLIVACEQVKVYSSAEVEKLCKQAWEDGYEGLVLTHPNSKYKYGRSTVCEADRFKIKPYMTIDAQIIGFEQATVVRADAEKKINLKGYSVTSKKKDDRVLVDMIANFLVIYEDKEQSVSCSSMKKEQKIEVWKNKEQYLGKWIQYKLLAYGQKNKARHPTFERFREDKD